MRPFTDRPPRRRARRPGIIRSLLGLLRPFDSERFTLREAMTRDDWRKLVSERSQALAVARKEADDMAVEIRTLRRAVSLADEGKRLAEAGMRHADGERDEAQKSAAAWEIEAADLRDRLVEVQRERDAIKQQRDDWQTLLDSERAAWREERAGLVRERDAAREENRRLRPLDRENRDLWRKLRACREYVANSGPRPETLAKLDAILARDPFAADPDPRAAGEGGADLLEEVRPRLRAEINKMEADLLGAVVPPPPPAAPASESTPAAVAEHAPPAPAGDHPLDRAPNMRRHDWDGYGTCRTCGLFCAGAGMACPGPRAQGVAS